MPFTKGDPSLFASFRALCGTLLWIFCVTGAPFITLTYLAYRYYNVSSSSSSSPSLFETLQVLYSNITSSSASSPSGTGVFVDIEQVLFHNLVNFFDVPLTCLAVFWAWHFFSVFVLFRPHMRGANRSYWFSKSSLVRSFLIDYFSFDVHFDTKITREWVATCAKNGNSKHDDSYDPEGEEAIQLASSWFPRSTPTHHQKYVIGNHPHAFIGYSIWCLWASIPTAIDRVFYKRGIQNITVHTFDMNFLLPFWSTLLSYLGFCSVTRQGLANALKNKNNKKSHHHHSAITSKNEDREKECYSTNAAVIVPGGAPESLTSSIRHDILLKDKGGFVKVALEEDALLVPVFHFGEEKAFKQLLPEWLVGKCDDTNNTIAPWPVKKLLQFTSIGFPLVRGKWGIPMLPLKTKLTAVIGEPLNPRKMVQEKFGTHLPQQQSGKQTTSSTHHHHHKFTRQEVAYVLEEYIKRIEDIHQRYAPMFSPDQKLRVL